MRDHGDNIVCSVNDIYEKNIEMQQNVFNSVS